MQVFGIREKQTKYYCCDCGKRLVARARNPEWRGIPANQKRCRRCSSRYRGLLKRRHVEPINALRDPSKPSDKGLVSGIL